MVFHKTTQLEIELGLRTTFLGSLPTRETRRCPSWLAVELAHPHISGRVAFPSEGGRLRNAPGGIDHHSEQRRPLWLSRRPSSPGPKSNRRAARHHTDRFAGNSA